MTRNIVDANGNIIGQLELPDTATEADWEIAMAPYSNQINLHSIVKRAMDFANLLMIEFSAENISMGITQAGKTKAVADYLANVIVYAQTGSLYEVINEVLRLQEAGIPEELSPFVTHARLESFKTKIMHYLS